jgi:hypothetical protein
MPHEPAPEAANSFGLAHLQAPFLATAIRQLAGILTLIDMVIKRFTIN